MKRFLLVIAFLLFSNVARADCQKMTVSEFYSLNESDNRSEEEWLGYFEMTGYLLGIRDFNATKYMLYGDEKAVECIGRPLNVWKPLVFDKYKLNKIKGDDPFFIHFIKTIQEVCEVDLFNIQNTNNESQIKVSEVIDGDTVKIIKNGEKITVRLADIDCFETSANSRGKWQAEYYNKSIDEVIRLGNFSKSMLHAAVIGELITTDKKVILIEKGKDKYYRTLGYLYINGVNINEYMLKYGKCEKYVPRKQNAQVNKITS
jgi:endonuclease YncB( thermonuclease family)